MIPVDGDGNPITSYEEWFDYKDQGTIGVDGKTSKWANAKSKDGSMWVWIPRYAYSIKSGYHANGLERDSDGISIGENQSGEIDIVFLKGTTDIPTDNFTIIDRSPILNNDDSTQATHMNNYVLHPSFSNNVKLGGWDRELSGFWVAKYEASRADATRENEGKEDTIKIQKGVLSWRNLTENVIFLQCKQMNKKQNVYGFTDKDIPHQMKSSEWGAVAYLAQSKYGRNKNRVEYNGIAPISGEAGESNSTTGNKTGIYDTAGGSDEFLAAHYKNGFVEDGRELIDCNDLRLKNVYEDYGNQMFGDALYETTYHTNGVVAWYKAYVSYCTETKPLINRGGHYENKYTAASLFGSFYHIGEANELTGFRPVVVI